MQHGALTEATDLSPARWVAEHLTTFGESVASIIPSSFEAYARVFHPAYRREGDEYTPVRWSEVAESMGRTVHPLMQWEGISGQGLYEGNPGLGAWTEGPSIGCLPRELVETLLGILSPATTTPDTVWFLTWSGCGNHRVDPRPGAYGYLKRRRFGFPVGRPKPVKPGREPLPPAFAIPGREYYLLTGPIQGALDTMSSPPFEGSRSLWKSANLWWPEDRAWFVSTEIDFAWTYVGGTKALIDGVLGSPGLEALPAALDDGVAYDSDTINPISHPINPS